MMLLILSTPAAYAFAKVAFPYREALFWLFLVGMMIPTGVILIPTFAVIRQFGLLGTRWSLIAAYTGNGVSFGIFLLRAHFYSIPEELEEAALLDGATRFGVFYRIVLPLSRPGLATLLIWHGLNIWNEFFIASVFVRSDQMRTWPLAIVKFVFERTTRWERMFAALSIATIPIIVLYVLAQEQFITGLTAGALKG